MRQLQVFYSFQGTEGTFEPDQDEVIIGRAKPSVRIDLDLSPDMLVSRPHARLIGDGASTWIEDLGSSHGTIVNHREIRGQGLRRLSSSDLIIIGETRLTVVRTVEKLDDPQREVWFSYNDKDARQARQLRRMVEDRGVAVWMGEFSLEPGTRWRPILEHTIQSAGATAVLVGKHGVGSFQGIEIECAIAESLQRRTPLIPVLLPGAKSPDAFGPLLKSFQWVDLRTGFREDAVESFIAAIRSARS